MSLFTPEMATKIADACCSNLDAISQSYQANLGAKVKFAAGELTTGCDAILGAASAEPGLFVLFEFAEQALAVLIPASLDVPGWYRQPDENQASRLQTLPMEWSMGILPMDLEATKYQTIVCGNLKKQLTACGLGDDAQRFEYLIQNPVTSNEMGRIQIIWPLSTPRFQNVADFPEGAKPTAQAAASPNTAAPEDIEDESEFDDEPAMSPETLTRQSRVLPIPVPLVVKIAQKRIDMRQLRGLAPGTLIAFDKSCDDPLEVFIGKQLYCRGEAVKMEEHFAIKITETGSEVIRPQLVHGL